MAELVLWSNQSYWDTYNYRVFLVGQDDYKSLFLVSRSTRSGTIADQKTQYDFTRIHKMTEMKNAYLGKLEILLDLKGKLDLVELRLTPDHVKEFIEFMTAHGCCPEKAGSSEKEPPHEPAA